MSRATFPEPTNIRTLLYDMDDRFPLPQPCRVYPLSTTASSPNLTLFFSNFGQINWDSWTFGLLREAEFGASVLFDRDGTMCSTLRCSLLPYPPFECACSFYFLLHFLDDFLLDRDSMYIIFTLPIIPYILRALELRNP